MRKLSLSVLGFAGLFGLLDQTAAQYADSVVAYQPGMLPTNVVQYTNASVALSEPARFTPGPYGGPVDPFDPPYSASQLLAIGTNGSLTVRFAAPITHQTNNPFGVDFIIFGSAGFTITNGDYSGGGITDGSLFSNNKGLLHVSVSADNTNYYLLNPALTPNVDGLFPTDGQGDFTRPVNPALGNTSFAGQNMDGIRALYAGSGGGTGYSLAWAQDNVGKAVPVPQIQFVRLEVLDGYAEIGGFAAVAPMLGGSGSNAATIKEDFAHEPTADGWRAFGDTNLFYWNPTNQNLEVTWDSSQANSYFYLPLGFVLTKRDNFSLEFDLRPSQIQAGVEVGKKNAFELALGFLNFTAATDSAFKRGTAVNSPNLVEFSYFPDTGFGATVSPVIVSTNGQFFPSFTFPLELTVGDTFHVRIQYLASSQKLTTTMVRNGAAVGPVQDVNLPAGFTDFAVDTVSINSYSDAGADGSILARGVVDNLVITVPGPPIGPLQDQLNHGTYEVNFQSRSNWVYTLETTTDFRSWTPASSPVRSLASFMSLSNNNSPTNQAFFRVKAVQP